MADRARRYREGRAGVTQVRISSIDHELAAVESELRSLGFPLDDKRYWQPHRERLILAPDNVRSREVARADEIYAARTPLAKMSSDELTEIRKYVTHRRHDLYDEHDVHHDVHDHLHPDDQPHHADNRLHRDGRLAVPERDSLDHHDAQLRECA